MSARYKVKDDDPDSVKAAQILLDATSGPVTTWLAAAVELDFDPKTCTEAVAIAFATELSLICEHMAQPTGLAKRVWTTLICQRIHTHMSRLQDAEEKAQDVPPTSAGPDESIN